MKTSAKRIVTCSILLSALIGLILFGRRAQRGDLIDSILAEMAHDGAQFAPAKLHALGPHGLEVAMDRLLQRTANQVRNPGYFEFGGTHYANGFAVFAKEIDESERITVLARKVVGGYQVGRPYSDRSRILNHAVTAIVGTKQDEFIDQLQPLLAHPDEHVPLSILDAMRMVRQDDIRYFPSIYLAALRSGRSRLIHEALKWSPNCWDDAKRPALYEALKSLLECGDDDIKFHVCFTLMHDFRDRQAIDYLIEQASSTDKNFALNAIRWLGDACNSGSRAPANLRAALLGLQSSDDFDIRKEATASLLDIGR